jgi:hypothetical protein
VLAAAAALPAPVAREAATALLAALTQVQATPSMRFPGAATLAASWALVAAGVEIRLLVLSGAGAGSPHSPWAARPAHAAPWAARQPHTVWVASPGSAEGYAAGGPHTTWAARPPHD